MEVDEGDGGGSSAKSPSYPPPLSTSLSSNLSLLLAPTCFVGTLEGPEATAQGVGGHSIDFVQDSRRRQRRGQPDPPLVGVFDLDWDPRIPNVPDSKTNFSSCLEMV
ncbi:hypothetical protein PV326_010441 [Microctonus aethiopoides]|nr:hypothetical protein PV326_010441 [Microctonus aethiopoides]